MSRTDPLNESEYDNPGRQLRDGGGRMSYQHTYPRDDRYLDVLTPAQRQLGKELLDRSGETGADLQDLLNASDAPEGDKQALVDMWDGEGVVR